MSTHMQLNPSRNQQWPLYKKKMHLIFQWKFRIKNLPSCWMSDNRTCCERGQGFWLKIWVGFTISHVCTTRARFWADNAAWKASLNRPWLRTWAISCLVTTIGDDAVEGEAPRWFKPPRARDGVPVTLLRCKIMALRTSRVIASWKRRMISSKAAFSWTELAATEFWQTVATSLTRGWKQAPASLVTVCRRRASYSLVPFEKLAAMPARILCRARSNPGIRTSVNVSLKEAFR